MRRLTLGLLLIPLGACAPAQSTTFHVDYAAGRDSADGKTPTSAWKHAPGDPQATAGPASIRLQPGDRILFRAGVPYRGTIRLNASGTAQKPLEYTGLGWGNGLGIIDGADPVTAARPCRDAADCGGAVDWRNLTRVEFAQPQTSRTVLYGDKGLYWLSQLPNLEDPFYSDERHLFAQVPKSAIPDLKRGVLRSPELAQAVRSGGEMELAFWVIPNLVVRTPLLSVEGDTLRFNPEGIRFPEDRDNAVALNGSFAGLQAPGRYVVLRPGVLVARLRPEDGAQTLSVGSGRMGIDLYGQSHVKITGLHFRNMTAGVRRLREGIAVGAFGGHASDIEISGNLFGPALLESRRAMVQLQQADRIQFVANRIEEIAYGGGYRAAGGKPSDLLVEGNVVKRTGSTAIGFTGVYGAKVRGNILSDIRGVHANGLTAYLGNRDILFENNCVVFTKRPLTFHGDRKGEEPNRIVIRNNILISSPDGQAAINSWGARTTDVRIENNLLVGPKSGLLLNASDRNVVVRGNDTSGIAVPKGALANWSVGDNRENLTLASVAGGQFSERGCSVTGTRIAPVTRARLSAATQLQ